MQVNFAIDDKFKLDDLLKLELHKFEEEVGEIVDRAQKEEKMEQSLAKLKVSAAFLPQSKHLHLVHTTWPDLCPCCMQQLPVCFVERCL